jgi:dihydroflavonol-4-reductase
MKILITGITGLVGSYSAKLLLEQGHEVRALIRKNADTSLIASVLPKIVVLEGDICDVISLEKAIEDTDWVLHAAGMVSYNPAHRAALLKTNVEGTANVVNACIVHGVKKLLHVSSVAALGLKQTAGSQLITEEADWQSDQANSNYALSKYLGELEVWRGIAEGLNAIIVNPSMILGEADWHKTSTRLFKYAYDQHPFYTAGSINYVDVLDVANIISKLLHSNLNAQRYILSAGAVPIKEFFDKTAQLLHRKPPYMRLGSFAIALLWRFEYLRAKITGANPLITRETADSAKKNNEYSGLKISETLGFTFQSLEATLQRVCENILSKNI